MKSEEAVNPRERARLMYLRSGKKKSLPMIARELGVSPDTVKSWKRRDGWDNPDAPGPGAKKGAKKGAKAGAKAGAKSGAPGKKTAPDKDAPPKRKKGGQPGNKNAVLNEGGAPPGNQNAVTTGEYARLLFSDLTEDEQALMAAMPEDTKQVMRSDLQLLCVREKRMLGRISMLQAGQLTNAVLDKIQNIEEGLTRLRREKQRIINALHEYAPRDAGGDDGTITIIYDYGDGEEESGDGAE